MKKSTLYGLITGAIAYYLFIPIFGTMKIVTFYKLIVGTLTYTLVSSKIQSSGKDKDINNIEEFTNEVKADFQGLNLSNEPIK